MGKGKSNWIEKSIVGILLLYPVLLMLARSYLSGRGSDGLSMLVLFTFPLYFWGFFLMLFLSGGARLLSGSVPTMMKNIMAACGLVIIWMFLYRFALQGPIFEFGTSRLVAASGGESFLQGLRRDADQLLQSPTDDPEEYPPTVALLTKGRPCVQIGEGNRYIVIRNQMGPPRPGHGWVVFGEGGDENPSPVDVRVGPDDLSFLGYHKVAEGVFRY